MSGAISEKGLQQLSIFDDFVEDGMSARAAIQGQEGFGGLDEWFSSLSASAQRGIAPLWEGIKDGSVDAATVAKEVNAKAANSMMVSYGNVGEFIRGKLSGLANIFGNIANYFLNAMLTMGI